MNTDFKKQYMDWLSANIYQNKITDSIYSVTFPYLDHNNDHIEIFIFIKPDGTMILSDDGETLNELNLSGMNIFSSDRRKHLFNVILNSHGVHLGDNNSLCIECDNNNLAVKKHMLAQCMLKVSDMFQLSRPNIQSLFIEEVMSFFDHNNIYGMPNVSFTGKSGLVTTYDFGISRSKVAPERLIKVVNHLDNQKAGYVTFLWGDTKEVRDSNSVLYVFIKDTDNTVPTSAVNTMTQYGIKPVLWSDREKYIGKLSA